MEHSFVHNVYVNKRGEVGARLLGSYAEHIPGGGGESVWQRRDDSYGGRARGGEIRNDDDYDKLLLVAVVAAAATSQPHKHPAQRLQQTRWLVGRYSRRKKCYTHRQSWHQVGRPSARTEEYATPPALRSRNNSGCMRARPPHAIHRHPIFRSIVTRHRD